MGEGTGFGIALLFSAFAFGFRHGIDWDHIAAITDITSSQSSRRMGLRFATLYAAGHAVVVFIIGVIAIVVGGSLPDGVDDAMGRVVGVTLIILGIYVVYSLIRYRQDFRMRSRWMLMFSGIRRASRWARGRRKPSPEMAMAGAGGVSHEHTHADPFVDYGTGTSLLVGALHGVGAETPTQVLIFLAAANAGGATAGIITLLVFLVGLFTANTVLAGASASGFLVASKRFGVYATVSLITAAASLVLGVSLLLGKDAWLPVLFGG
jgi:high-affinity nickel-transport protein